VLLEAEKRYRAHEGSLLDCIARGNDALDAEYARRVLRGVLWELDLQGWEAHPMRRRADVWKALKTAIRWCSRRTGGWRVGKDRPAIARVPSSRQWLEWVQP